MVKLMNLSRFFSLVVLRQGLNLEKILNSLTEILKPKARIAIIGFHSLEDAIVKKHFQKLEQEGILKILTKKPIEPTEEEINHNPKSRSAKLRVATII